MRREQGQVHFPRKCLPADALERSAVPLLQVGKRLVAALASVYPAPARGADTLLAKPQATCPWRQREHVGEANPHRKSFTHTLLVQPDPAPHTAHRSRRFRELA